MEKNVLCSWWHGATFILLWKRQGWSYIYTPSTCIRFSWIRKSFSADFKWFDGQEAFSAVQRILLYLRRICLFTDLFKNFHFHPSARLRHSGHSKISFLKGIFKNLRIRWLFSLYTCRQKTFFLIALWV